MTSLAEQLQEFKQQFEVETPTHMLEVLNRSISLLQAEKIQGSALKQGDKAPDFELSDTKGHLVSLKQTLTNGPCILTFFRGGWCPYCMLELSQWQTLLEQQPGLQLIAITPEVDPYVQTTKQEHNLSFPILTDKNNMLARQFGLLWRLDADIQQLLLKWNVDLQQRHNSQHFELPVPATYIIDSHRNIHYSFIEEDYTLRAEPQQVLKELQSLTE